MSYDNGYQQRPYNGPAAPRPPPQRQYPPGPNGPPPPQQYDQYQDGYDQGYGYDDYGGGYGQDYGQQQYDDMNYQRGPPPPQNYPPQQDYYGPPGPGRGRPMGPGGRGGGGPMPRQYPGDGPGQRGPYPPRGGMGPGPGRGSGPGPGPGRGYSNGPPGRGPGRPLERAATSDPSANRGRNPMSPHEPGFGGSPFPAFPGHIPRTDLDQENQILGQMENLEIGVGKRPSVSNGQRGGPMGPGGPGPGPGPMGPPPQRFNDGYGEPRRGPGPGPGPGPDPGYGPGGGFGPPMRTMTMPNDPMGMRGPPPGPVRADTGFGGPGGRGMPARPSTAQGMRGPPRAMPPPNGPPPQGGYQGGGYDAPGRSEAQQRPASFDDFYDYYGQPQQNKGYPENNPASAVSDGPNFDAMPPNQQGRNSFDQHMGPGPGLMEQRAPARVPEISRTKSQPDLRQPQAAVFEMAADLPPIPNQYKAYQVGLPEGPAPMRQGSAASTQSAPNPDVLPSHPTPVRPGLMPNSVASQMVNKPAPVRSYTNMTPPAPNMGTPQLGPSQSLPSINSSGPPRPEPAPPVTPDELERLRAMIKANPDDQATALRLAKRLVEAIDVIVPTMPDPRGRAKMRERYAADAHKIFKKLSHASNGEAMFAMADCLGRGVFGGEPDNKEAFTLYQSAAKIGVAPAAYRTAVCCEIGQEEGGGTRKDPAKAVQWYRRAATLGDTPAMYKVGMILLKGLLGQPRNPREAVGWLKRAAERADAENPHALHELGLLYESAQPNDVILRDEAYAFRLFQQAADLGYKFSQFRLGSAFEYGLMGCPIDPRLSIMWYSRAATQEEHQSELALSGWYLTGAEGVLQQSDTEAYLWARKAAVAGLAKAEYAMGYFTETGIGVPANLEDAKRWYWRAAAQDFPKARERLEDLKRAGKNTGPRQRERISRSTPKQEGECVVM